MRFPPVAVFLTFPTPNYIDPITRGKALIITNVVFMALMTAVVALRFYARITLKRWLGLDDWSILASLVCVTSDVASYLDAHVD